MLPAINCSETYIALIKFVATEKGGNQFKLQFKLYLRTSTQELCLGM